MSTKRQPSKQRRQSQNQRQRAALETRRVNAAAAGAAEGAATGGTGGRAGSATSSTGDGSLLARLRGSAGRAVFPSTPGGTQPVGHRAALSALLAAVAGAVVGAFMISVPVDASGDAITTPGALVGEWTLSVLEVVSENPDATAEEVVDAVDDWSPNGEERYGIAYFPLSLTLLLPIVGAAVAFRAVARSAPAKVVNRAMYVTLFGTLLSGQLPIFLPTVVGVGIAAFQVRKAEVQAAAAADPPSDDDGVIDVDEVEADELAEDDTFLEAEEGAAEADADDDEEPQRSV